MEDQRRLPEDGSLPPLPTGVHKSNNIMIIKVPDESSENQYQLATLDRTQPGTEYSGDKHIDKLIPGLQKVTISKEPEKEYPKKFVYNDGRFRRPHSRSHKVNSYKKKTWRNDHRNRPDLNHIEPWKNIPWGETSFHAMDTTLHLDNSARNLFHTGAKEFYSPALYPNKGLLGDCPASNNHFESNNYPVFPTENRPNNSFEDIRTSNASYQNFIPRTGNTYPNNYGRRHGPPNSTDYKKNRKFGNDDHPSNFDSETSRMNLNAVPMPRKQQSNWCVDKTRNPYNRRYGGGRRNFGRSNGRRK